MYIVIYTAGRKGLSRERRGAFLGVRNGASSIIDVPHPENPYLEKVINHFTLF